MMMPAVHPWLISLRDDILKAKTALLYDPASLPTDWMVGQGPNHMIREKKAWIQRHGGGPPRVLSPSSAAILERIRASRKR